MLWARRQSDRSAVQRPRIAAQFLRFARISGAALCILSRSATAQSAPVANGWRFQYVLSNPAPGGTAARSDVVLDVAIWKDRVRVDVRGGPLKALAGDSGYVLLSAADTLLSVVNPSRREVLILGSAGLAAAAPIAMQMTVSGVTVTTRRVGAGARIAGFATEKVESAQAYSVQIANGSMSRTIKTVRQVTLQRSDAIARLSPGFLAFAEQFLQAFDQPGPVRTALRPRTLELRRGFPVTSQTVGYAIVGSDSARVDASGRLQQFRAERVDSAMFFPPTAYRVTEMSRLLQQRPRTP
jgi:hypothetical protein